MIFYLADVKSQNPWFVEQEIFMARLENKRSRIVGTAVIFSHYAVVDDVKMSLSTIERYDGRLEVEGRSAFSRD